MSTRTRKPSVKLVHGQAITTSLKVAEVFGKRHTDVLRTIRNLECSPEFTERNFALSEYADTTGRKLPMYTITRDGFAFLASGFTGKEAAQWKEKYIAAFNELERRALEKATARRLPKPAAQAALPTPEKLEDSPSPPACGHVRALLRHRRIHDAAQRLAPVRRGRTVGYSTPYRRP